jgi:hypothetical protein
MNFGGGMDPGEYARQTTSLYGSQQNQFTLQQLAAQNANQLKQAQLAANTQRYGYDQGLAGQKVQSDAAKYGYDKGLSGQQYQSDRALQQALGVADRGLKGTMYSSDASKESSMYGADAAKQAAMFGAQAGLEGTKYSSDASARSSMYGADAAKQASMYGSDQSLAGVKYGTDATNQRFHEGLGWAQDKFGQIFGFVKDRIGGLGGTSGGGFDPSGAPPIDAGPVFTPGQVQANVNNAVGMVDQRTQGENAGIARQGAARGIGGRSSPLMQALMQQNTAIGNGQAADAELKFRTNAAQLNAQNTLESQKARYQGWNQTQALGLQQQKNALDYNAALLSALAGIGGGGIGV